MSAPAADPAAIVPRLVAEVEAIRDGAGTLRLRGPLLRRPLLLRWFAWLFARPKRIEVELDDIGSWVVERCDGRSLQRLAGDLAAHLKLTRREAETALADFVKLLLMRRLLRLEGAAPGEPGP
jgi:hypothetical protein